MTDKNKITSIKIDSYKVNNTIELVEVLIQFICILKKIKLSKTEIQVLSHFMIEGYSEIAKEQILEMKILHSKYALRNILTNFRKQGILTKERFREVLSADFRIPLTQKVNINITLDNN